MEMKYEDLSEIEFGCVYSKEKSIFKVYATNVISIYVRIYDGDSYRSNDYLMKETEYNNIYELELFKDLKGNYYNYVINREGKTYVVLDPYSYAVDLNSRRTYIFDKNDISVKNFEYDDYVDIDIRKSIIYETHIRDMTYDLDKNIKNRGKFLGVIENENDDKYGLNYIKNLGVTHIHYLPLQDIASLDDKKNNYNWGYDPKNYFAIEGTYSTDANNPLLRIIELKEMVKKHHKFGLGVILDVVYNHVYRVEENSMFILSKETYFRFNKDKTLSNGSGCGNELNTENPIVQKLIIDSLKYLCEEFHIDGFRFDLMALLDVNTMKMVVETLKKINKNIILYGEPWMAQDSVLNYNLRTDKSKHIGISMFNDDFRNALKGDSNSKEYGYIQGNLNNTHNVLTGIAGSIDFNEFHIGFARENFESINYLSCHDNLTLYDKIKKCGFDDIHNEKINKIAFAILLLSFGVPFIHAGSEFLRTKYMDENSYISNDFINKIDWSLIDKNSVSKYVRDLIILRKELEFFQTFNAEDIRKKLVFLDCGSFISYKVNYYDKIYIILINPSDRDFYLNLKELELGYVILFENYYIDYLKRKKLNDRNLLLKPYNVLVLEINENGNLNF